MKKIAIALAVGALSIAASAQTNQVLSRNAVGYVRVDVRSNGLTMVRMPFFTMPATNIAGIIGTALHGDNNPNNADKIQRWNTTGQVYISYYKRADGNWRKTVGAPVDTTDTITPGEAFWIRSVRLTNQVVYLMGEVPDRFTLATFTTNFLPGLNMSTYAYPVDTALSNIVPLAIANANINPNLADQIKTWDKNTQQYLAYYAHTSGWRRTVGAPVTTTNLLAAGEGMWYQHRGVTTPTWVQTKPYTWP